MQALLAAQAIRYTITGTASPGDLAGTPGTELQIINEALQAVARRYPWHWLSKTTQPLSLIANQPWVDLPADFDDLIAIVRGPGLLTWMAPMTEAELLEYRAGSIPTGDPFGHYYLLEHATHENPNRILDSEDFSTGNWVVTNATVGSAAGVSPEGVADASLLTGTTVAGTIVQELGFGAAIESGRTYVASLFVKAGTSALSEFSIRQGGAGGETTSVSPLTTVRLTWTSGVPAAALQTSQGAGAHDFGVEPVGDGWYRVWVLLTIDTDKALPSSGLFYIIRPAVSVPGTNMVAWGAQLEQHSGHHIDSTLIRPSRYRPDTDQGQLGLRRQLTLWPTPTTTQHSAFLMRYRAKPPTVGSENDNIAVPWFLETIVLEACRHVARGWHSEDIGTVSDRLEALWRSTDFIGAIARDGDATAELGPMRGTAAGTLGAVGRNWNQGTVAYPGALA